MEVQWEDGTGVRRKWSSWTDDELQAASWHEAEKLLPASATDINVQFQVHGLGGPWDVCKVDRQSGCSWMTRNGEHYVESFCLRSGYSGDTAEEVDAVFELCGGMQACYVCRAWNAGRCPDQRPERWELWEDPETCPRPEPRCPTLEAADQAALIGHCRINRTTYCLSTTKRLCAALHALLEVHRNTLESLRELDAKFTGQWVGVNVGNTASAGMGIASAVFLFMAPPVGIGLGVGSAVTSSVTFAGDSLADWAHASDLKRQMSADSWNSFVVAELLREWMQARQALVSFPADAGSPAFAGRGCLDRLSLSRSTFVSSISSAEGFDMGDAVDNSLTIAAAFDGTAVAATRIAERFGQAAFAASQALGVAGALLTTGFAIRGWSTSKAGQTAVRQKLAELSTRMLQIQQLLASIDRLDCPLCQEPVILSDSVVRCSHEHHCFHAACLRGWQREGERRPRAVVLGSRGGRAGKQQEGACGLGCDAAAEENREHCPQCGGPLGEEADMLMEAQGHRLHKLAPAGRDVAHASGHAAGATVGGCRLAQEALMAPVPLDGRRRAQRRKKPTQCGITACFASC